MVHVPLDRLDDLDCGDGSGVEGDVAVVGADEAFATKGDDPAFFDDHFFDDVAGGEGGAEDGRVLPLRHAGGLKLQAEGLGEDLREAVSWRGLGVHGARGRRD